MELATSGIAGQMQWQCNELEVVHRGSEELAIRSQVNENGKTMPFNGNGKRCTSRETEKRATPREMEKRCKIVRKNLRIVDEFK